MTEQHWKAPTRTTGPLDWTQNIPGSKSETNRAYILAALADAPSTLHGALRSRDTDLMEAALRAMGIGVDSEPAPAPAESDAAAESEPPAAAEPPTAAAPPADPVQTPNVPPSAEPPADPVQTPNFPPSAAPPVVRITPGPLHGASVDTGLAGTVMRFLPPVAALADGEVHVDGDEQARARPMHTILDALRQLGVDVEGDSLPFVVRGRGVPRGGEVTVDASGSSQFVSGLLLSGARYREGITVTHSGGPLPSLPHIEMTLEMLRQAGVTCTTQHGVENSSDPAQSGSVATSGVAKRCTWRVEPGPIRGRRWDIQPDLSNATPFLAAAALTGGMVRIPRWPARTTQPGDAIRDILMEMGATVTLSEAGLTVQGPAAGQLRGITRNMGDIGELTPTVAALAALASTPSQLTGIAHLRGHETDRLAALTREINALGGRVRELADGLAIDPAPLHGGLWHSYADHRMATAGAIIGLVVPGVLVENIDTTSKTLPGFADMWEAMVRG